MIHHHNTSYRECNFKPGDLCITQNFFIEQTIPILGFLNFPNENNKPLIDCIVYIQANHCCFIISEAIEKNMEIYYKILYKHDNQVCVVWISDMNIVKI